MRLALGALALLATLGGALYAYERFVRRSPLRFTYLTGPLSESRYRELSSQPGWARDQLEVAPGVRLNGLVRRPRSPEADWILLYPGNDDHMLARGQKLLTRLAQERDLGLAVFAYRGFDSSAGTPELSVLALDAGSIWRHVAALVSSGGGRLHAVGFSIGGHLAVRAAAAEGRGPRPVASLTLLASVNDIVMLRRAPWQKFALGDALRTQGFLSELATRVLVLQGSADEALAGPVQGRAIAQALGGRARYEEFEGIGHEALLDHEPALASVRAFIAEPD